MWPGVLSIWAFTIWYCLAYLKILAVISMKPWEDSDCMQRTERFMVVMVFLICSSWQLHGPVKKYINKTNNDGRRKNKQLRDQWHGAFGPGIRYASYYIVLP